MTWNDITLRKWNNIERIINGTYDDDIMQSADLVNEIFDIDDSMLLTPQEFKSYIEQLSFLKEPIPEKKLCNTYTINGTKYNFKGNIMEVSMGQLMDWRQYSTKTPLDYAECLSVFMIPDGHKYNDGYDMDKTIEDLSSLPIADAMKLYSFFVGAQILFTETLTDYLNKELKKTNLPKEKRQEIMDKIADLKEINSTFCPMHSAIVK